MLPLSTRWTSQRQSRPSPAPLLAAILCALMSLVLLPSAVLAQRGTPILNYTLTEVNPYTTPNLEPDHWSRYVEGLCDNSAIVYPSYGATRLISLDIRTDFFSKVDAALYVSVYGFLTTMSKPMCDFFCRDNIYDTLHGFYQFTNDSSALATLGGDWPMIGLYVAPLNTFTFREGSSAICITPLSPDTPVGERSQTVVYENYAVAFGGGVMRFSGQVTVYENGTIIMRYRDVPANYRLADTNLPASTGLVLTKRQRYVARTPGFAGAPPASKRFEPQRDRCAAATDAAACLAMDHCGWCRATSACSNVAVAADQCPSGFFDSMPPVAPAQTQTDGREGLAGAYFYDVSITQAACYTEVSTRCYSVAVGTIEAPFRIPYFGNTTGRDDDDNFQKFLTRVTILYPSVFSLSRSEVRPNFNCNPLWDTCIDGQYPNSVALFSTPQTSNVRDSLWALVDGNGSLRLRVNVFYPRVPTGGPGNSGSALLNFPAELLISSNGTIELLYGCPAVVACQLAPVQPTVPPDASSLDSSSSSSSSSNGSELGATSWRDLWAYPPPLVGLIREGPADTATLLIPPLLIREGTRVVFTPKIPCPPCAPHGRCDLTTGTCVCDDAYTGAECDRCSSGLDSYPSCPVCPTCKNGGTCTPLSEILGRCVCSPPYSGADCSLECAPTLKRCEDTACMHSDHGVCECDRCVCSGGYTGTNCDVPPADPCLQYSIDGCPQCNAMPGLNCSFCFDGTCFSPALADTVSAYACSYSPPAALTQVCRTVRQPILIAPDLGYILLGALTCFTVLLYLLLGGTCIYSLAQARRYNYDVHAAVAAGGVLDFKPARREREIAQTQLVYQERVAQRPHVLGFVLNQISLKKLYKRQRGMPVGGSAASDEGRHQDN